MLTFKFLVFLGSYFASFGVFIFLFCKFLAFLFSYYEVFGCFYFLILRFLGLQLPDLRRSDYILIALF